MTGEPREGEVLIGYTLFCMETGETFFVTVGGKGNAAGGNFVNALRAAAQHTAEVIGCGPIAETVNLERTH